MATVDRALSGPPGAAGNMHNRTAMSTTVRHLKVDHLKKKGDEALKQENFRAAIDKYAEAIALSPEPMILRALYSNRALAFLKLGRFQDALADGDAAAEVAPTWDKAHWRRGCALEGLQRIPESVHAFHRVRQLTKGEGTASARLRRVIQKLTRQQLAQCLLDLIAELEAQGTALDAKVEKVPVETLQEAAFQIIKRTSQGPPKLNKYYDRYYDWLTGGLPIPEAKLLRSRIYAAANCFIQAAEDGASAVRDLLTMQCNNVELAEAYRCQGAGLLALPKHPDRRAPQAAIALIKALDRNPDCEESKKMLEEAVQELTKEEYDQVCQEVFNQGSDAEGNLQYPEAIGFLDQPRKDGRLYKAELTLAFRQVTTKQLTAGVRQALRKAMAEELGLPLQRVTFSRVTNPTPASPFLLLRLEVSPGPNLGLVERLRHALTDESILNAIGEASLEALGQLEVSQSSCDMDDITPAVASPPTTTGKPAPTAIVEARPPKMEIEVPYKSYHLVRSDGSVPDRTDKHPFCMSRVYYDASEKPEEIWAEIADGSCRWRQSGSEIKICCLRVPRSLEARNLLVIFEPYYVKVAHRQTGEVYLEGALERGIVPEDCVWTHGGGTGEDGMMLYLQKMNLELLQKHWMHSEMWWPRLFRHHPEIAWDDYEKDYSDLPEEVLAKHRVTEAIKDEERALEAAEKSEREILQERDDLRRRTRQERIHFFRTGTFKPWVELQKEAP